jgi:hypothetical protein
MLQECHRTQLDQLKGPYQDLSDFEKNDCSLEIEAAEEVELEKKSKRELGLAETKFNNDYIKNKF